MTLALKFNIFLQRSTGEKLLFCSVTPVKACIDKVRSGLICTYSSIRVLQSVESLSSAAISNSQQSSREKSSINLHPHLREQTEGSFCPRLFPCALTKFAVFRLLFWTACKISRPHIWRSAWAAVRTGPEEPFLSCDSSPLLNKSSQNSFRLKILSLTQARLSSVVLLQFANQPQTAWLI